jgi:pimeloyl-ACP methyl ester carboxylesterase
MTHPVLPARRIVALLLVAAAVCSLALIRSAKGPDSVAVPPGAHPGQITLEPCEYEGLKADCGTLVVPENRRDPRSRMIALPVTRVHARSPDPGEPVFRLEGGPGRTNMQFPGVGRFNADRDVVLVGYRGVDGSSQLQCPEVSAVMEKPRDLLGPKVIKALARAFRDCSNRLQSEGVDLAGYTVPQRVDDLEAARVALGYGKVDLVSESAGTRYAMVYSWRHPSSVHRSVMIGVNPPGRFLWKGADSDAQIRRYAELCAADERCRSRTGDLTAAVRRGAGDAPDRWMGLPVHAGNVSLATFFGLMETSEAGGPLNAPMTLDALQAADQGDASGLWMQSLMANLAFPQAQVWGEVAAMARADRAAAKAHFAAGRDGSILGNAGSRFLFGEGDLVDAWPGNPDDDAYAEVQESSTETLMITGELDGATPPANIGEVLPKLRNGHRVVLEGIGHTGDFWHLQKPAATHLITTFLDSGRVDASKYVAVEVDLDPSVSHTVLAKSIAGGMLALPLLCALVLAGVARRVRRRGRLQNAASATMRTLFASLAGLAGWMLSALVVLAASVPVGLTDRSLAMVAVAFPVAAAVYAGWLDRGRPERTRRIALAATVAGAVVGSWIGHGAAEELVGLFTAILGAVTVANLALIAVDVTTGDVAVHAAARSRSHISPISRISAG